MTKETAKIVRQLWTWVRPEYCRKPSQEEVDARNFGYGITYKDIRQAAKQLP